MTQERSPCPDLGGYVRDPAYHLMRLRMLLTCTNAPEDAVLRDALIRLNAHLEKDTDLLSSLRGERKLHYDIMSDPREDGGVRIWSYTLRGLHLSGADSGETFAMLPDAIKTLLIANEGVAADEIISIAINRTTDIPYKRDVVVTLKPLPSVN
ncbi:hypothetical protein CcrColossus_gp357 [Caulobacter phage CcrColossus]|uniref:Uncharacterized protein n=1 Tax=Caulobacter phage CcrColossus TaxID=1211640 RepID=K4K6M3_9CAUD|nr:hypothetical protein CcrColossus_gp357 [Caulobacter phage CcrColossus]AFU88227.1 hypothetical protein CcrColossus_gp357 [Caulobacter phage CcrColossus]